MGAGITNSDFHQKIENVPLGLDYWCGHPRKYFRSNTTKMIMVPQCYTDRQTDRQTDIQTTDKVFQLLVC